MKQTLTRLHSVATQLSVVSLAVLSAHAAMAPTVTGEIDPTTGLQTLSTWVFNVVGVAIPTICPFKQHYGIT